MEESRSISNSIFLFLGAVITWIAIGLQFYLIIVNRVASVPETIIRFFSFFTILTNILVAVYYSALAFSISSKAKYFFSKPGVTTAVTVYITLVGLGYQFLLRHIWNPQGWSMVADELLHSVTPLYTLLIWLFRIPKENLKLSMLWSWSLYPVIYLILIVLRGAISGFYPYYFIDVGKLGYKQVLVNSLILLFAFFVLSGLFILVPKIRIFKMKIEP